MAFSLPLSGINPAGISPSLCGSKPTIFDNQKDTSFEGSAGLVFVAGRGEKTDLIQIPLYI